MGCRSHPPGSPKAWPRETPGKDQGRGQPRPSSHVLGRSQSWDLRQHVSTRNLPELSLPFAGISQKAQGDASGLFRAPGERGEAAVMPETSGPESTDSCDHFSYFKPSASGGSRHTHEALQPDLAARTEPGLEPRVRGSRSRLDCKGEGISSFELSPCARHCTGGLHTASHLRSSLHPC